MKKWLLRSGTICVCVIVIVITAEKFFFSSERAQLFAWWFFSGNGDTYKVVVSQKVNKREIEAYKKELTKMLSESAHGSLTQKVALSFSGEFSEDPTIQEQLIIISYDHPDHYIKCKLRKQLSINHDLVVTTHNHQGTQSSRFSRNRECED